MRGVQRGRRAPHGGLRSHTRNARDVRCTSLAALAERHHEGRVLESPSGERERDLANMGDSPLRANFFGAPRSGVERVNPQPEKRSRNGSDLHDNARARVFLSSPRVRVRRVFRRSFFFLSFFLHFSFHVTSALGPADASRSSPLNSRIRIKTRHWRWPFTARSTHAAYSTPPAWEEDARKGVFGEETFFWGEAKFHAVVTSVLLEEQRDAVRDETARHLLNE